MKQKQQILLVITLFLAVAGIVVFAGKINTEKDRFISYTVDPKKQPLEFFWKNEKNEPFRSILNLKRWLEKNKLKLVFAMNGGMYKAGNAPLGLYIEKGKTLSPPDTANGNGNFYLK